MIYQSTINQAQANKMEITINKLVELLIEERQDIEKSNCKECCKVNMETAINNLAVRIKEYLESGKNVKCNCGGIKNQNWSHETWCDKEGEKDETNKDN